MATESCYNFTIYAKEYFYPVHYTDPNIFFGEMTFEDLSETFNDSYVIHFWNKLNREKVGSNQVYGDLANKYCHGVYHSCGQYF